MNLDVEDSGRFFKTDPKPLSDGEEDLIRTVQSSLELHHELKFTLQPQKLNSEGSDIYQVPGADYFLNRFIKFYKGSPKMRDDLYVHLLRVVVAKISGNQNSILPLKSYNFFSVSATH